MLTLFITAILAGLIGTGLAYALTPLVIKLMGKTGNHLTAFGIHDILCAALSVAAVVVSLVGLYQHSLLFGAGLGSLTFFSGLIWRRRKTLGY